MSSRKLRPSNPYRATVDDGFADSVERTRDLHKKEGILMDDSELKFIVAENVIVEVLLDDRPLQLTARDRVLLAQLARAAGRVVLRDRLIEEQGATCTGELYNWIHRLRKRLPKPLVEQVGGRCGAIQGAGAGYRLTGVHVVWGSTRGAGFPGEPGAGTAREVPEILPRASGY